MLSTERKLDSIWLDSFTIRDNDKKYAAYAPYKAPG